MHPYTIVSKVREISPDILNKFLRKTPIKQIYWKIHSLSRGVKGVESLEVTTEGLPEISIDFEYPSHQYLAARREGIYEPLLSKEVFQILEPGMVFYDVGSKAGYFTQIAMRSGVEGENVYGFEMREDKVELMDEIHEEEINTVNRTVGVEESYLSLDDYVIDEKAPDVIKIDVEGSEYSVLKSAEEILQNSGPVVFIEVHLFYLKENGRSPEEIGEILAEEDYSMEIADHRSQDKSWKSVELPSNLPDAESSEDDEESPKTTYLLKATPEE